VINEQCDGYVTAWEEFRFLPGALDALAELRRQGLRLAVITNQSAVGRGLMTAETLAEIHERMSARCADRGVAFEGMFVCPHAPEAGCRCRKPRPGLIFEALARLGETPARCVAIGDDETDLRAARNASVPFILVRTGRGEETLRLEVAAKHPPAFVARDLRDACDAVRAHFEQLGLLALEAA